MIADLKPYPAMKDSGVPWLGEVPEHWEVQRPATWLGCASATGHGTNKKRAVRSTLRLCRRLHERIESTRHGPRASRTTSDRRRHVAYDIGDVLIAQ